MLNRAKEVSMRGWLHARARCIDSAVASLLARRSSVGRQRESRGAGIRGGTTRQNKQIKVQRGMCAGTSGVLALAGAQGTIKFLRAFCSAGVPGPCAIVL